MSILHEKNLTAQSSNSLLDEKNIVKKKKNERKKIAVKASYAKISPVVDMTEDDFFELKNGEFLEILQLESKDIYSLNESDLEQDIYYLDVFFSTIVSDIKIVPLNVPLNLEKQKDNMYRCLHRAKQKAYKEVIQKRIDELEKLEKTRTNREYFIFFYAASEKRLREITNQAYSILQMTNPLLDISREKKLNILFQLNNMNTKPLQEREMI